jgi:protein phosphatase
VVTRAIGLEPAIEVDTFELQLRVGDRLLICSDGLSVMLDDAAISLVLTKEADPAVAVRALIDAANRAGGDDNISVVIVDSVEE